MVYTTVSLAERWLSSRTARLGAMLDVMAASAVGSPLLRTRARISKRDFSPTFSSKLARTRLNQRPRCRQVAPGRFFIIDRGRIANGGRGGLRRDQDSERSAR
jgi:hypothetical protein